MFKGGAKTTVDPSARMRDEQFWGDSRKVELTKSESSMDDFINNMTKIKGFKYILFGAKALIENHVEIGGGPGKQSKFDIGPINTIVSNNFVDGLRFRASGQTTAALNPHLFGKATMPTAARPSDIITAPCSPIPSTRRTIFRLNSPSARCRSSAPMT